MRVRKAMSNKGFTLIELLAVIIVLGLILGITYPAISSYIGEAKDTTYDLHEADMKTAATNMMTECVKDGEDCAPAPGRSKKLTLKDLVDNDYTEKLRDPQNSDEFCDLLESYVIVKNEKGSATQLDYDVCLVCGNHKSAVCETSKGDSANCDKEEDTKNPTCGSVTGQSTLWTNGDRVISVNCSDDGCGCKQDTYYKKFTESTTKANITIEDEAGRTTDCPVNVYVDKDKPECTLSIIGAEGEKGWYGGNDVKVFLNSMSDRGSGVSTYGIGTSNKNYNFDKSTKYVVKPGITTVYGYVKDNAGNIGTCSVEVKYDPVLPTSDKIRYGIQVYEKEDIASVSGNVINLNSFTSEYGTLYGAMVYLKSEHSGGIITIKNGATSLVSRTVSAGVTKMEFTFSKAGKYTNLKIDLGSIPVDQIERIEVLTDNADSQSYFTNKNITVYVTARDSLSGLYKYSFDGGNTWQSENYSTFIQNQSIQIGIQDIAGNKRFLDQIRISNIDKVQPSCTFTLDGIPGNNGWYISDVGVKLNTFDTAATTTNAMSGVRDYDLKLDSSVSYSGKYSATQTADTTATTWYGFVRDKAGNTNTCNIVIHKDTVKPTCEILAAGNEGNNGWYTGDVTISLITNDVTSKVDVYGLDEIDSKSYNNSKSTTLSDDTTGKKYYGYVMDKAGLTNECPLEKTIKKDETPPTCSLSVSDSTPYNGYYLSSATLTLESKDETSGVSKSSKPTLMEGKNIEHTAEVFDKAGNKGECSITISVDLCKKTSTIKTCDGECPACGSAFLECEYTEIGISGYVCGSWNDHYRCTSSPCPKPKPEPSCPCGDNCSYVDENGVAVSVVCTPTEAGDQDSQEE